MPRRRGEQGKATATTVPRRRRLGGVERRRLIVKEAAQLFADHGFAVPTRGIAERLGVTQALLYKYFPSKQALIAAVFDSYYLTQATVVEAGVLAETALPLDHRLARFYAAFSARMSEISLRLFLRAALDGLALPTQYAGHLDQRILFPLLETLRREAELPPLAKRPPSQGERELAMALHGSVVFLGIRRFVYRIALPAELEPEVALQVRAFLPGALAELRRLQSLPLSDPLAAPYKAVKRARRR